jgi:hypothetical protein
MPNQVLNLREAAQGFAKDSAVIEAVAAEGVLVITAGKMAEQTLPDKPLYQKLAKAIGADTPLFRFTPSKGESAVPYSSSITVFLNQDNTPVVMTPGLFQVDGQFISYKLGIQGYALYEVAGIALEIDIAVDSELPAEIRRQKEAADVGEEPTFPFSMEQGVPTPTTKIGDVEVRAIRSVPQREIPPHSEDVPLNEELKVTEILASPTREYGEPRLNVVVTKTGEVINGLIATAPIRQEIGENDGEGYKLTEKSVGAAFEILERIPLFRWVGTGEDRKKEAIPVLDRNGKPALDANGKPRHQMTVVVRRTDVQGLSL